MDEVFRSDLYFEGDLIIHKTTQPTENLILERNNELRKNPDAIRDLKDTDGETWGRMVATIPLIVFEQAIKAGYQLRSREKGVASKELFRFLQTPIGKTCLVRDKI